MTTVSHTDLRQCLHALPGVTRLVHQAGAWWACGDELDVHAMAGLMSSRGIRLGTITAVPLAAQGETRIVYHWVADSQIVNVETVTRERALPSLATGVRAAGWAEREIHDLFGVTFVGHPNPAPLLKPEGFDSGMLRAAMCGPRPLERSPTVGLFKS
jgi:NADH-quinone oxidoreductase subunit C